MNFKKNNLPLLAFIIFMFFSSTASATVLSDTQPLQHENGYTIGVAQDNNSIVGLDICNLESLDSSEERDVAYNQTMNYAVQRDISSFTTVYSGSEGKRHFKEVVQDTLKILSFLQDIGKLDSTGGCNDFAPRVARFATDISFNN